MDVVGAVAQTSPKPAPAFGFGAQGAVVAACTVGNFVSATPMVNSVFGVFLLPLSKAFGWPRAEVSGVLALIAVIGALAYPIVGRIADRYGARRTILIGNLLFAASIAALALANGRPVQVYFLFALVGVAAAIPSTVLYGKVVAGWFAARRGLMLGVTAGLGNGVGATVMPGVAAILIGLWGWRGAYLGLGLIVAALGFPILFLALREAPKATAAREDFGVIHGGVTSSEARRDPVFVMLAVAIALGAGSLTALFTHVVALLLDRHIPITVATGVIMAFALSGTGWQLAFGYLLDRASTPKIAAPFFLISILGVALIALASAPSLLLVGGLLVGLGLGAEYGLMPYALARYFGLRAYGETYGLIYGLIVLTMGVTPMLMDLVFDRTGAYAIALAAIGVSLALSAGLILLLPRYRYTAHGDAL
jgi:MFS family permease